MARARTTVEVQSPQPLSADLFTQLVRKGFKRLRKALDQGQHGADTENVHRMRRATRHFCALLDVCGQWEKSGRWQVVHEGTRELQQLLGPLRDMQVRVDTLAALVKEHPGLVPLLHRAQKQEQKERNTIGELLAGSDLKEGAAWLRRLERKKPRGHPRPALLRTIARERHVLHERWTTMQANNPRSMHRARVALRRLTHLLSMMAPHLGPEISEALPGLKRLQGRLGRTHDTQVLLEWITATLPKIAAADRPAVVAFLDHGLQLLNRRMSALLRDHPEPGI